MGFSMFTKKTPPLNDQLLNDLVQAFEELGGWGSVEVYVQNGKVTQITKRAIKKTNHQLQINSWPRAILALDFRNYSFASRAAIWRGRRADIYVRIGSWQKPQY